MLTRSILFSRILIKALLLHAYDLQSNLKMYQWFNKASSAIINMGGLISGTYFVEISSGTYKERQQLII